MRNRIKRVEAFVKRARRRAKCAHCGGRPGSGPIVGPDESGEDLHTLIRSRGADIREVKERIRRGGWTCRKCLHSPARVGQPSERGPFPGTRYNVLADSLVEARKKLLNS